VGSVPCQRACSARLGEGGVHGNGSGALGALGVTDASEWHGQSSVHGRARVKPPRGIDPRCRGGSGGEVTERGVDGGALTQHAAHRRQWRHPGRRRGGADGSLLRGVG
jgi:hypothetical protein